MPNEKGSIGIGKTLWKTPRCYRKNNFGRRTMKDPAFLFYSADFQIGTEDMTDEQVGKYIRLMCRQHLKGHISEEHMKKICKTYDKDVYEKFEIDENGFYYNVRLDAEIEKRRRYSESRAKNRQGKKNTDKPKQPRKIKPEKEFMNIEGVKYTNLTKKEYETLIKKYDPEKVTLAINIFDTWLEKGSKTAKQYIGKAHYAHFKSDGWVWERATAQLAKQQRGNTNYGI